MSDLSQHCFLKALRREPTDYTPVWLMRQAGRYLPEYRQLRQQAGSFMALCTQPELACEVTLQPLRRFDLDAAILFSDILTIPDAMGLGLKFIEGKGPVFQQTVRSSADLRKLGVPDPQQSLRYVMDTIQLLKRELGHKTPLIGFAGSPWTIATYMIEGCSNRSFSTVKAMIAEQPQLLHQLLLLLTEAVTQYLNAQIEAGVDAIMIFDTWGSLLIPDQFQHYSLQHMAKIIANLNLQTADKLIPSILFTRESRPCLEAIADSGCSAIGVDWTITLAEARSRVGQRVALQGNLDPQLLKLPADQLRQAIKEVLASFGEGAGHIFNLGHGITPDITPESVAVLVDSVHEFSRR